MAGAADMGMAGRLPALAATFFSAPSCPAHYPPQMYHRWKPPLMIAPAHRHAQPLVSVNGPPRLPVRWHRKAGIEETSRMRRAAPLPIPLPEPRLVGHHHLVAGRASLALKSVALVLAALDLRDEKAADASAIPPPWFDNDPREQGPSFSPAYVSGRRKNVPAFPGGGLDSEGPRPAVRAPPPRSRHDRMLRRQRARVARLLLKISPPPNQSSIADADGSGLATKATLVGVKGEVEPSLSPHNGASAHQRQQDVGGKVTQADGDDWDEDEEDAQEEGDDAGGVEEGEALERVKAWVLLQYREPCATGTGNRGLAWGLIPDAAHPSMGQDETEVAAQRGAKGRKGVDECQSFLPPVQPPSAQAKAESAQEGEPASGLSPEVSGKALQTNHSDRVMRRTSVEPMGRMGLVDGSSLQGRCSAGVNGKRALRKYLQVESFHAILDALDLPPGATVVDFGSGTGNLGLPLAAAFPHLQFVCVDMKPRAVELLIQRCEAAGLTNVRGVTARIEQFREPFAAALGLHTCGRASDLAQLAALRQGAHYILSPCCLGKILPLGTSRRDLLRTGLTHGVSEERGLVHQGTGKGGTARGSRRNEVTRDGGGAGAVASKDQAMVREGTAPLATGVGFKAEGLRTDGSRMDGLRMVPSRKEGSGALTGDEVATQGQSEARDGCGNTVKQAGSAKQAQEGSLSSDGILLGEPWHGLATERLPGGNAEVGRDAGLDDVGKVTPWRDRGASLANQQIQGEAASPVSASSPPSPVLSFPRSAWLRRQLSAAEYAAIARCADFTGSGHRGYHREEEVGVIPSLCKGIVEIDRNQAAAEAGYATYLTHVNQQEVRHTRLVT
eukprot:jgi/Mesvir1/12921/Mv05939-RA.3